MAKLDGKVVILTGGGGSIARGMIAALAKEGADLCIAELDPEKGQAAAREAEKHRARAIAIRCDVSQRQEVDACVAATIENFGRIDVLINNATGATAEASNLALVDHDGATFDRIHAVDVMGTFHFMQACFPHFEEQGGGKIINFASGAGTERMAGFAAYAAAKEAVRALTGVAAREFGPAGVNVNVVCPAALTEGIEHFLETHPDPTYREKVVADAALRRLGDPELDIGRVVVFLASDDSSYLTGQTLWVDGGQSIHA